MSVLLMSYYRVNLKIETKEDESEEEFENFNEKLMNELREIQGISDIRYDSTNRKAPDKTRSSELIPLGEIVLTFLTTGGFVALMDVLNTWLGDRKKTMRIDLNNRTINAENYSYDEIVGIVKSFDKE
jgi:hypothetical protein